MIRPTDDTPDQEPTSCSCPSSSKKTLDYCPFIQLPRELRDLIYSYTFYQPEGLFYYRDQAYKARLCGSKDTTSEFNQLKYTCQQFRRETMGLELKLRNDITFFCSPEREGEYVQKLPGLQFLGFLDMCHEKWRCSIKRIFLRDFREVNDALGSYGDAKILDMHLIVRLCHNYPNFQVLWEFPIWEAHSFTSKPQDDPHFFLSEGLMFSMGFRSNTENRKRVWQISKALKIQVALGSATVYQRLWREDLKNQPFWVTRYTNPNNEARNFRMIPRDGPLDEAKFRRNFDKWIEKYKPTMASESEAMKEGWVALAREWYETGI